MTTLEVGTSPQGFCPFFFQLIYDGGNTGTFRIPLKDQFDDPPILIGSHFTVDFVVAKQVIATYMVDALLGQALVCPAKIFRDRLGFLLGDRHQSAEDHIGLGIACRDGLLLKLYLDPHRFQEMRIFCASS